MSEFETCPNEELIADNLASFSGDLFTASDIKRFLEIATYDKPNSIRFVAWLAALRIIDTERIKQMPDIVRAMTYYDRCIHRYYKTDYHEPLRNLINGPDIRVAVESNLEWFKNIALFEGLTESIIEDAAVRLMRILAVLSLDNSKYKFTKSDERIVMICYVIALCFARRGTLTNYFAEAFAFHMSNAILSSLNLQREIIRMNADQDYSDDFQKYFRRFTGDSPQKCKEAGVNPMKIYDEMIWTMFTNTHDNGDCLLLIFDLIILHLREYRHYTNYLVAAHFKWYAEHGGRLETDKIIPDVPFDANNLVISVDIMKEYREVDYVETFLNSMCPCFQGFNILFGNRKVKKD